MGQAAMEGHAALACLGGAQQERVRCRGAPVAEALEWQRRLRSGGMAAGLIPCLKDNEWVQAPSDKSFAYRARRCGAAVL